MKLLNTLFQRTKGLLDAARRRLPARLSEFRPSWPQGEVARAAAAGAILFGIAGAGLGAQGAFKAFEVDKAAAGATLSTGWGYMWVALAAAGAVTGALFGAGASYAGRRWLNVRYAGALLLVGALGGIFAGATWGSAVARERVLEVRAQHAKAKPLAANGPRLTVINGPVRLDGSVARRMNLPLLSFMVLGGTLVGALAARGLAHPLSLARREEPKPVLDDLGRQRFHNSTPTGSF